MWKKLAELERRNTLERNALTASSNNPVPATNTSMTRTRPWAGKNIIWSITVCEED